MNASPSDPRRVPAPSAAALPRRAGAGFKPRHLADWLADPAPPAFAEVHAENYMGAGGPPHVWLDALRGRTALSVHGVGLSLGGARLDHAHLERLAALVARHAPAEVSEHLAWSSQDGRFLNDLLPLRYDRATLERVCAHVARVQDRLQRRILVENPSRYLALAGAEYSESEFLGRLVAHTGCGLLLDVTNVFVSCHNLGLDADACLRALPLAAVGEIHLAGHARDIDERGDVLLIDHHGGPVADEVWDLYELALDLVGPVPTLVEWDNDVPDYGRWRAEVARAQDRLARCRAPAEPEFA